MLTLVCPTDDAGTKTESTKVLFNKIEVPLDSVIRVLHSWDHELDMYKASLVAYMKARVPNSPLVHGHVPPPSSTTPSLWDIIKNSLTESINDTGIKLSVPQMRQWREDQERCKRVSTRKTPSGELVSPETDITSDEKASKFEQRNIAGNRKKLIRDTKAWLDEFGNFIKTCNLESDIIIINPPVMNEKKYSDKGGGKYMQDHIDKVASLQAEVQDLNNEKKSLKRSLNEAKSHVKNNTNEMIESNKKLKSEVKTLEKSLSNAVTSRSNIHVRFDDASRELTRSKTEIAALQVELQQSRERAARAEGINLGMGVKIEGTSTPSNIPRTPSATESGTGTSPAALTYPPHFRPVPPPSR